ncbi:MAG: NUDIX hydrolase [Candidatus Nanogingivalaceae bacterium]|nr:NUDIX hydrolase [Candidatus Nanogingivalaceae bacterium]
MNNHNKPQRWHRLSSQIVFSHPRMTLAEDEVKLPDGKTALYLRQVYQGKGGVIIVCQKDDKVLVQQEYSYPVDDILYQFPGGKIEEGETPEQAARRELAEESNVSATTFQRIGWFYADNRRTNAKLHVVYARGAFRNDYSHQPDETEFISTGWLEINKLENMIAAGQITNYAILAAWTLFNLHRR